jgi:hypothetical protein
MSDRSVSDLVFRDLEPDRATTPADTEEWHALLREELDKLRPSRPAPRVIPATETLGPRPSSTE